MDNVREQGRQMSDMRERMMMGYLQGPAIVPVQLSEDCLHQADRQYLGYPRQEIHQSSPVEEIQESWIKISQQKMV